MTKLTTTGRHILTDAAGSPAIRRVQQAFDVAGIVWERTALPGGCDQLLVLFSEDADRARRVAEEVL